MDEKFFLKMEKKYQQKISIFPNSRKKEKQETIEDILSIVSLMIKSTKGFHFGKKQYAILKWKLAQYFQPHESIDLDILYESLISFPSFLEDNQDRIVTLIELYKKTKKDELLERFQDYSRLPDVEPELVLESICDIYTLVKLVTRKHLDDESTSLRHCIGNSEFYSTRMMRGEYEIYSLRTLESIPLVTIVLNTKENKVEQVRKLGDKLLDGSEEYYQAHIEALIKLRGVDETELVWSTSKQEVITTREIIISGDTILLAELTIPDLGLENETRFTYEQMCSKAFSLGYQVCTEEEALGYVSQFPVQNEYSFYYFGMSLKNEEEIRSYLCVGNNEGEQVSFWDGMETQLFVVKHCIQYGYKFIFKST